MNLPTLTQIGKGEAIFQWYSEGALRYELWWKDTDEDGRECLHVMPFDIPVAEAGGGQFTPTMKGLSVLRWARKHVEMLKEAHADQAL